LQICGGISANDLRADEGRETEALNCKPITNLKEKSELSNYCKPAVFVCTLLFLVAHTMCFKTQIAHTYFSEFSELSRVNVIN
jgi:hypothetical protein